MPLTTLLALGFGNLAMLGWLAAAAAPLLIHLWSRHRYREAPWAAMQFLLAAMRKNARRLQLQQWLLLAVRTMIIALVVVAVAEPYGDRILAGGTSAPTHKILVIDGSYSMAFHEDDASRFARARQAAADIVRDSRPADTFTVIVLSIPSQAVVSRELIDQPAVAAHVEELSQRHTGADLAGALTLVEESLSDSAASRSSSRQVVYFFTDLQRVTWQGAEAESQQANNLAERLDALAKRATLLLVDVGERQSQNLAVTSVNIADAYVSVGRDVTIDATLHQFGDKTSSQCAVELIVDGVPVSEQTVDIPAGGDAAVRFTHQFRSAGEHTLEVRASSDNLEIDNSRYMVVPVRDEVRVLSVAGKAGAARYVSDALNPNPAGESPIRPVVVPDGDLTEIELTDFDCIFLCNVAQLTASDAERIKRYSKSGGGVVMFLGDRVVVDSYNALAKGDEPLLPAALGNVLTAATPGLDPLDYRHPIVAPFRGQERSGLLTTPISRYFKLELLPHRSNVEVAATISGNPFIVTAPFGLGRIVLVATDGSLTSIDETTGEPWTNWPTWPSFLPIVRELFSYATGGQRQQWQQLVGSSITSHATEPAATSSANASSSSIEIKRPDGKTAAASIRSLPSGLEWSYAATETSGIYSVSGFSNGSRQFAVNVDPAESDLAQASEQQLPKALQSGETLDASPDADRTAALSQESWNVSLLWTALALLFVESFMAWKFGRGTL